MALSLDIKAMASPALLKRGCVNVIGLEALRAHAGARWEKMRDSIYARLEALLRNKLGPTDFFIRLGDMSYLVATPSCDGDDARLCCLKIAYELHRSLLGNCIVTDLSLCRVSGDNADALELRPVATKELVELALRGGIEELYRDFACPTIASSPLVALEAVAPAETPPIFRFAPVWNVPHEAVTAYRLEVEQALLSKRMASPPSREVFKILLKVFLAGFAHASRMLTIGLRAGGRYLMIVPISYDILSVPAGRMDIAAACRNLPSELRPFLIFEIHDLPSGVPQSRMSELICSVRPFCRAITIVLAPGQADHATFSGIGHQGLGLELQPLAPAPGARDEIAKLGAAAKRLGMTSIVTGVSSLDLADCARRAGVIYICGDFIGPEVDIPQPMRLLSWDELVLRDGTELRRKSL